MSRAGDEMTDSDARAKRRYHVTLLVFFVITIAFLVHAAWIYPKLPERVPVHFTAGGEINRMSSKAELLVVNGVISLLMLLCFGVLAMVLQKVPTRYWNLPNKDYWLAPERFERSSSDVGFYYVAMGIATMILMWSIHLSVCDVAMGREERLQGGTAWLIGYFVVLAVLCLLLYRRFSLRNVPVE